MSKEGKGRKKNQGMRGRRSERNQVRLGKPWERLVRSMASFRGVGDEAWEKPVFTLTRDLLLCPPWKSHSMLRKMPVWCARGMRARVCGAAWVLVNLPPGLQPSLEPRAGFVRLTAFSPTPARRASPVPAPRQAGNLGDQAAATVLQAVRPQVSLVLLVFAEIRVRGPGIARAHLPGSAPVASPPECFPGAGPAC